MHPALPPYLLWRSGAFERQQRALGCDPRSGKQVRFEPRRNARDEFYTNFIERLSEMLATMSSDEPVSYIVLAIPGLIDIPRTLTRSMAPFVLHDNTDLAADLAERLWRTGDERLRRKLGVDSLDTLRSKILVDNDIRCAARYELTTEMGSRRSFACLHVGTGVGVGLVLDGHVYYGSHTHAGEFGHTVVHQGATLALEGSAGAPGIPRERCCLFAGGVPLGDSGEL